jgi:DNA-binding transcriptional LysR family regulator
MSELRIFIAVLEHRGFRKAAAALHLTQPAVTKAFAGLEDTLGVTLFDRAANGVEPTAHGRSLAPRARAVFDELRRAAQDLTLLASGAVGSLRVGVLPMPVVPFVPLAVNRLLDEHPAVRVLLVEERETELLDRLRRRDIELAILRPALVVAEDDLRAERLLDENACVVAARTHPLAAHSQLQWTELLQQRWVLPPADCSFREHMRRSLERMHMPMPRHAVEATSVQLQFELVRHAGMLSFGMCSQVGLAPGRESVVRLPFDLPVTSTSVAAVRLKSHEPSPLARLLVGHIQAHSTTLPPPLAPARPEFAAIEAAP